MNFWMSVLYFVVGALVGAVAAYFLTRKNFEKQLKENPPINEKMIRAMYAQMGRKPSEAQINQVINAMNRANTNNRKKANTKDKAKKK